MTPDELKKLLNLKPTAGGRHVQTKQDHSLLSRGVCSERSSVNTPREEASPFALNLDLYDQAQGGKLLRHNHHLRTTNLDPEAVSDLYAMCFLSTPRTVKECKDPRKLEYVTQTMATPDYLSLHRSTEHNPVASELATQEFAQALARLRHDDQKREDRHKEQRARGKPVNEAREALQAEMACLKTVGRGLKEAAQEVENYEDTMTALGCGPGQGGTDLIDVGQMINLFQRTKDSDLLRRIMELAGRYRRAAQARQRQKTRHGYDDMVGVTLDGDVGRLLPHELGQIAIPELELNALRRLVERQCMCRDYRGVERVGKGPIVVVVDESGSMAGEPVAQAKAFALAMAWIARHQKRWCALVGFAGDTVGTRLVLPPSKWDEVKLMEWLEHFFSGGTSCDVPCHELPHVYWPEFLAQGLKRLRTDCILITDALVHLPTSVEKSFLAWKQAEQVRCITMVMGQEEAGDLARISDEVYPILHLNLDQECVQRCLGI